MVSFGAAAATAAAASVLVFASFSNAQSDPVATFSLASQKYGVRANIPPSGNDIFLQLSGPATAGWVGTGIGTQMKGALIFIIYSDGNGNVTVSPRLGLGEFEPKFEPSIDYALLGGSGIENGIMTANIRCGNCREWSGGSLDVKTTSQNFIWSIGNEKVASTKPDAEIHQHQAFGFYSLNLKDAASTSASSNPFLNAGSSASSSAGSSTSSSTSIAPPRTKADKILIAHGVIMAVTFVLLFPFGAALIRLLNTRIPNPFALHRGLQIFNLILVFVGLGMGVWRSNITRTNLKYAHQVLGVVIVCMIPVQAVLGQMHHNIFLKTRARSFWSYGHIWFGRLVIILGVVNGGIGLGPKLADAPSGWVTAYVVIAGLMAILYASFYLLKERSVKKEQYAAVLTKQSLVEHIG